MRQLFGEVTEFLGMMALVAVVVAALVGVGHYYGAKADMAVQAFRPVPWSER